MLKNPLYSIVLLLSIFILSGPKSACAQAVTPSANDTNSSDQPAATSTTGNAAVSTQTTTTAVVNAADKAETAKEPAPEALLEKETMPEGTPTMELKQEPVGADMAMPAPVPQVKVVKSIDIVGNKSIGITQILSKIKTRVGQEYVENIVSDDLKRLYNLGFFADVQIDHEDLDGGYKVIVKVKEKSIIEEVTFSKIKYYSKKFIESKIKTKKDKFLDNKTLKDDINVIEELYKKKGLTQAKIDVETFADETTNKVSLHFIIREGFRMKIKRINVYGNTAYRDAKIIKAMKSRPAWLFNSGYLKEEDLEEDMTKVQSFYEQNGYIDAKASYKIDPLYKGLVNVDVTVEEGKRYYVGELSMDGNLILSETDIRIKIKNMREGNVFSREKLQDDVNAVRDVYFDRGYISASVVDATSFNTESGRVDVKLTIKEGKLAYIDKIKIQGNATTRDIVIRRELRMYPGDQFDGAKLRKSKDRLRNLGYFEDVGYDIEDTDQDDQKNLVVQVKEAKTGSFSFGGGYSTVDKLVGFVELEQKNFDIANWPSFTGGGQDLRIRGEIGSSRQNAELSFTEPWVFDYPVSAGFDLFATNLKKDSSTGYAYDERRTGGDLRLGKSFNDNLSVGGFYRLEQIKINNLDSNVSSDLAAEEGTNVVSSVGVSQTFDYRDSPLVTTRGWMWRNSADLAGGVLSGDKDFYRLQTEGSYYHPFRFNDLVTVLAVSGRTGMVKAYSSTDKVPIFERYFAGGSNSIRGYNERKVGPLDPNTNDPIGGETIMVGSAEYTVPIIEVIKAAAFYDIGNVWAKSSDWGNGGLKSGTGLGLRVKTPIGPLKLDYGIPLNKEDGEEKKSGKFYFSVSRGF